jgi:hypothetical protein
MEISSNTTDTQILEQSYERSSAELEKYSNLTSAAKDLSEGFSNVLHGVKDSLISIGDASKKSTAEIALYNTAILGTRKMFEGLSNIDSKGLNLFRNQYEDLINFIKESPIGSVAAEKARSAMALLLTQSGASKDIVAKTISAPIEILSKLGKSFIDSADNGLKFTNVMVQLAGKSGDLGKIYGAAGPNLENFNLLLKQQSLLLSDVAEANHLPIQTIHEYYAQLGTIPGAMNAVVKSSEAASDSFNMLTGAVKLARGSGRTVEEITEDMRMAFKNYNMTTGDDFLQFSARMTELNTKFGASFDVVRDSLRSISSDFVMFGNNAESATKILNNYIGGLKATGLSGDAATQVVTGMAKAISGLNLAQRSFLSVQSGMSGGLMGGYKIEDMMRKGQTSEVMDLYIKQIQKLSGGGKMVTVEEASKSQKDAAILTKQTLLLQSFGLGKGSEGEAHRIIEGLRQKQDGNGVEELKKNITQELMGKGTQLQQMSATDFSQLRSELEGVRVLADITNFDTMKSMLSAHVGRQGEITTAAQVSHRQSLKSAQESAAVSSGARKNYLDKPLSGVTGDENFISGQLTKAKDHVMGIDIKSYTDSLPSSRPKQSNLNQERFLKSDIDYRLSMEKTNVVKSAAVRSVDVNSSARKQEALNTRGAGAHGVVNMGSATPKLGELTVNITGYCIKCKREIEGGQQAAAVNPASMGT